MDAAATPLLLLCILRGSWALALGSECLLRQWQMCDAGRCSPPVFGAPGNGGDEVKTLKHARHRMGEGGPRRNEEGGSSAVRRSRAAWLSLRRLRCTACNRRCRANCASLADNAATAADRLVEGPTAPASSSSLAAKSALANTATMASDDACAAENGHPPWWSPFMAAFSAAMPTSVGRWFR